MEYWNSLVRYFAVSSPYLLVGLTAAGVLHRILKMDYFEKKFDKKNASSVFWAAVLGVPLPLCSCSVIPAAVALKKSGASNAATSSFLIATPESGVDSIMMTKAMMDIPMTVIRPLAAFFTAIAAGMLQFLFKTDADADAEKDKIISTSPHREDAKENSNFIAGSLSYAYGKLIDDIALWLTVGMLLGALIDTAVPADFFPGLNPHFSRLAILCIGIPLYICATASTPVAAALILKGMSPGSALLLLLVGPATNVSNIVVLQKYLGKKAVLINLFAIAAISLAFSYAVDILYSYYGWAISFGAAHHGHDRYGFWSHACSIVLALLLLKGIWMDNVRPRLQKKDSSCH